MFYSDMQGELGQKLPGRKGLQGGFISSFRGFYLASMGLAVLFWAPGEPQPYAWTMSWWGGWSGSPGVGTWGHCVFLPAHCQPRGSTPSTANSTLCSSGHLEKCLQVQALNK